MTNVQVKKHAPGTFVTNPHYHIHQKEKVAVNHTNYSRLPNGLVSMFAFGKV